jgi:uncharacterized coiled-coil protein SlyX
MTDQLGDRLAYLEGHDRQQAATIANLSAQLAESERRANQAEIRMRTAEAHVEDLKGDVARLAERLAKLEPCERCGGAGGFQETDLDNRPTYTEDPCKACGGSGLNASA